MTEASKQIKDLFFPDHRCLKFADHGHILIASNDETAKILGLWKKRRYTTAKFLFPNEYDEFIKFVGFYGLHIEREEIVKQK